MGLSILLDTNAIIGLLKNDPNILVKVNQSNKIYISIINILEFKSFTKLSANDIQLFEKFVSMVHVIPLNSDDFLVINKVTELRQKYHLKLPDAIIAACAIVYDSQLITADKAFAKVENLALHLIG